MVNHIKGCVHPQVFTPFLRFLEFTFPSMAHCAKNEKFVVFSTVFHCTLFYKNVTNDIN